MNTIDLRVCPYIERYENTHVGPIKDIFKVVKGKMDIKKGKNLLKIYKISTKLNI